MDGNARKEKKRKEEKSEVEMPTSRKFNTISNFISFLLVLLYYCRYIVVVAFVVV